MKTCGVCFGEGVSLVFDEETEEYNEEECVECEGQGSTYDDLDLAYEREVDLQIDELRERD